MKHQGQTMSETISMVSLGLASMRWSFLLVVIVICLLAWIASCKPWAL